MGNKTGFVRPGHKCVFSKSLLGISIFLCHRIGIKLKLNRKSLPCKLPENSIYNGKPKKINRSNPGVISPIELRNVYCFRSFATGETFYG